MVYILPYHVNVFQINLDKIVEKKLLEFILYRYQYGVPYVRSFWRCDLILDISIDIASILS